jgi:PTH1 family peptidyl-tRNA hydrolase
VKLVVGLGNPGPDYERTRHNVGFRIVERLAARHRIALRRESPLHGIFGAGRVAGVETALLEPQTYMNLSGRAVLAALDAHPIDARADLLVVYDDLDLPFGRLRLRPSGGAGGHNGIGDITDQLGHDEFARLRFGIGRPPAGEDPIAYVLAPFAADEDAALPARLDAATDAIELAIAEGVAHAMNRVNAPPPAAESPA